MNFWYKPKLSIFAFLLVPLSCLFGLVADRRRQRRNRTSYSKPVIVVGNISVGGTGKTPTLIWLVKTLQAAGMNPAIISRGYKANPPQAFPVPVDVSHSALDVGDEPLLLKQRTDVPVVIDPDRHRAVAYICEHLDNKVDIILSDDGMQHYRLYRDVEIAMIDPVRGVGNGQLLPAGPLREPISRLMNCDFILAKSSPQMNTIDFSAVAEPDYGDVINSNGQRLEPQRVCLMSGIGNPESFRQSVLSLGFEIVREKIFKDHQRIPEADLSDSRYPILVTEKDFVKLSQSHPHIYYLPFNLNYPESLAVRIVQLAQDLINEKSRHNSRSL